MRNELFSSFDPNIEPFPGMDLDDYAQAEIEGPQVKPVKDEQAIDHGCKAIQHLEEPNEILVYRHLAQSGLTKKQIRENIAAILSAAGPRFAPILQVLRIPAVN